MKLGKSVNELRLVDSNIAQAKCCSWCLEIDAILQSVSSCKSFLCVVVLHLESQHCIAALKCKPFAATQDSFLNADLPGFHVPSLIIDNQFHSNLVMMIAFKQLQLTLSNSSPLGIAKMFESQKVRFTEIRIIEVFC